ncbi:MAG: RNA polymerase sigma factor [Planctomycetes bacterium]|nr:RNA polymerase sigma factor [Planctomycetota bacterium]
MDETDAILVERAQAGDREAFSRLVDRHMRDVYAFAYRMTGTHADADDVAQQAFVNAFAKLWTYSPDVCFRAWVFTIAGNLATDLHRRKSVRREVALADRGAGGDGISDPVRAAIRNETGRKVWEVLETLPPDQRAVLVLHGLEGIPMAELARAQKTPEATVRWRFSQGLNRLKAAFGEKADVLSRREEGN